MIRRMVSNVSGGDWNRKTGQRGTVKNNDDDDDDDDDEWKI